MTPLKKLGELLVGRGAITAAQMENALALQKTTGEFLGFLLVRVGWITQEQLVDAFSEQFGIPRMPWEDFPVDWSVADQFPMALISGHASFPVQMDETVLTVVIANPLDAWAVSAFEKAAKSKGRKLKLMLATGTEIAGAVRRHNQISLRKVRQLFGGDHAKQKD